MIPFWLEWREETDLRLRPLFRSRERIPLSRSPSWLELARTRAPDRLRSNSDQLIGTLVTPLTEATHPRLSNITSAAKQVGRTRSLRTWLDMESLASLCLPGNSTPIELSSGPKSHRHFSTFGPTPNNAPTIFQLSEVFLWRSQMLGTSAHALPSPVSVLR